MTMRQVLKTVMEARLAKCCLEANKGVCASGPRSNTGTFTTGLASGTSKLAKASGQQGVGFSSA